MNFFGFGNWHPLWLIPVENSFQPIYDQISDAVILNVGNLSSSFCGEPTVSTLLLNGPLKASVKANDSAVMMMSKAMALHLRRCCVQYSNTNIWLPCNESTVNQASHNQPNSPLLHCHCRAITTKGFRHHHSVSTEPLLV